MPKALPAAYVPLGGVAVSSEIAEYFGEHLLSCGLTYSGHPLACAAGCACVSYYEEAHILPHVEQMGKVLGELLEDLKEAHPCVGDVRYIGLFSAIELVKSKETKEPLVPYGQDPQGLMGSIIGLLRERKFMTYSHENMILVAPPLIITEEQLRDEMEKWTKCWTSWTESIYNTLEGTDMTYKFTMPPQTLIGGKRPGRSQRNLPVPGTQGSDCNRKACTGQRNRRAAYAAAGPLGDFLGAVQ